MAEVSDLKIRLLIDRYRLFFLPVIFAIFVIFSLSRIVMPRFNLVLEGWQELKETKARVEALNTKLAFLQEQDEETLKADYEFLLQILPETKDPFSSLSSLEWLGGEVGLRINQASFTPGEISTESAKPKKDQDYLGLSYIFSVSGSLAKLEDFLLKLEKLAPLASIDEVDLELGTGDELTTSLEIVTYSAYLPVKIGKPSDPIDGLDKEEEKLLSTLRDEAIIPDFDSMLLVNDPLGKADLFN